MDKPPSPSLLDYARFHGIATPAGTTCPLDCLNTLTDQACENDESPKRDHLSVFENNLSTIEQELHAERLNLSKKDALFLSAIARDMRTTHTDINWDNYLPSMRQIEGLRVEMPALMTHHESDLALLKEHVFFDRRDTVSSLLRGSLPYPLVPEGSSDELQEPGLEVIETLKSERLNCSRESLGLIQNAMRCGDIRPSDGNFHEMLRPYLKRSYEPENPIEPLDIDQFYSPPPTSKPQMLPSPVSSDPVDQYRMKDKTLTLNSASFSPDYARRSERVNSSKLGSGQLSIIPPEGDFGSPSDICPPSCGQPSDVKSMSNNSENELEHITEPIIHVHPAVQKTHSDVACSSELDSGRQPLLKESFSSPVQSTLPSTSFESQMNKEVHPALSGLALARNAQSIDGFGFADPSEVQVDIRVVDKEHLQNHEDCDENSIVSQGVSLSSPMNNPISPISNKATEHISTTTCLKDITGFPGQAKPIEVPPASSDTPDQQVEWYSAPSHKRPKRKNKRRDSSSRKHQRRPEHRKTMALSQAILDKSALSSPFTELGSLSAFMETRGKSSRRRVNTKSPYFAEERVPVVQQSHIANVTDTCPGPNKQGQEVDISTELAPQYIPENPKNSPGPTLIFLSTSLLKSHLGLVRVLERKKDPTPTLIYRDYDDHSHGHQNEADIIISPSSAILLTTSQATTQLYLPGHKPSHPQLGGIKAVNSPLRERIVLLAPRYDRLYILVCHTSSTTTGKPGPTADKRTLESIVSLTAFCNSLSGYSAIIPSVITPSTPETVAEWTLSLAHRHSFPLSVGGSTDEFTPINPGNNTATRFDPASMETETQWERFLRYAGLNPFAAQAILAVLRREENNNPNSTEVPGLSRFIEMPPEHRRRLFAGIIGDRVLGRVEAVIEQDWHCDWALDFDAAM